MIINKIIQNKVQSLIFLYFILPSFQFTGFLFIQFKVIFFFGACGLFFLHDFVIQKNKIEKNYVILLYVFISCVILHMTYTMLIGHFFGVAYFYIKIFSAIVVFLLILTSKEVVNSRVWSYLIISFIIVAFLQQMPISRTFFMATYGSVQGYISDFPYSRASGLSVGFYIYTQIIMLLFLILKMSTNNLATSKSFQAFTLIGSLISNTRSTFTLPFYYLFIELRLRYKFLIGIFIFIALVFIIQNFAPIRVIYHHLILVYEAGNLEPIINSQNSSFAQRVAKTVWFSELFSENFSEMFFLGLGAKIASGQEIGYFLIITQVGFIMAFCFYFMPLILAFSALSFKKFTNFFILILPVLACDLLLTGFAKFDLYILYWVFTAFYIKNNRNF